jgi:hypothetical protein
MLLSCLMESKPMCTEILYQKDLLLCINSWQYPTESLAAAKVSLFDSTRNSSVQLSVLALTASEEPLSR